MDFSLIVPTRERPHLFRSLCESIHATTANKSTIEVLSIYDKDDSISKENILSLKETYPWIKPLSRERGTSLSKDYQTWAYQFVNGRFVFFLLHDDCRIATQNWDIIALERIYYSRLGSTDLVFYGNTADPGVPHRLRSRHYSFFPIIGGQGIEAVNYVMHHDCGGWGTDCHLWMLYQNLGRIIDMNMIYIDHVGGSNLKDSAHWQMKKMSKFLGPIPVNEDVKKLNAAINNTRKILL